MDRARSLHPGSPPIPVCYERAAVARALARVVDTSPDTGSCGVADIVVPADWLAEPTRVALTLAKRIKCGRCHGGGCDGCGRSGAIRLADEADERELELALPGRAPCEVRLRDPFGAGHPRVLLLRIQPGDEHSAGLRRLRASPSAGGDAGDQPLPTWLIPVVIVLVAVVLGVLVR